MCRSCFLYRRSNCHWLCGRWLFKHLSVIKGLPILWRHFPSSLEKVRLFLIIKESQSNRFHSHYLFLVKIFIYSNVSVKKHSQRLFKEFYCFQRGKTKTKFTQAYGVAKYVKNLNNQITEKFSFSRSTTSVNSAIFSITPCVRIAGANLDSS